MKKFFKSLSVTSLAALMLAGGIGCGSGAFGDNGNNTSDSQQEQVDVSKTQLLVSNYDGGVGHTWLDEVEARFEEAYKDYEFEPGSGKKGIQIRVSNHKNAGIMGTLSASSDEVFFMQEIAYGNYVSDFVDITDVVTEWTLPGETGTIEDKLSDKTKGVLTSAPAARGEYRALPHYLTPIGIQYNVTMFKEKNFYFADDIENSDNGFILSADQKKSCGPDGVYDTSDDGLPSSVEELYQLCVQMDNSGVTPFIWYGGNLDYSTRLVHALWASLSGETATLANVSFDTNGEAIDIITGFNGTTPITQKVVITEENGYEMTRQASKYYALDFAQKIFSDEDMYDRRSLNTSTSHTTIQENFLRGYISPQAGYRPAAMLLEGTYWENEARDSGALERTEKAWKSAFKTDFSNYEYATMPLPVQATGRVTEGNGKKQTAIDMCNSYAFINKHAVKDANKLNAAKMFLQFCYTDISLQNFTMKSGVTKDVNYSLTQEQYASLTYHQKSAWDLKQNGSMVILTSGNSIYSNHSGDLTHQTVWNSFVNGSKKALPLVAFREGISAKDYFEGMKQGADSAWWTGLKN